MSSVVISGDTSGTVSLTVPAVAGTNTITLPAATGTAALLQTPSFATTIGVGGATASASGSGITFPATQSASTDANTLDDYEEGTWTPTISGMTVTSGTFTGTYTKIGRVVTVIIEMGNVTLTGTPTLTISGLPFTNGTRRSTTSAVAAYNVFGTGASNGVSGIVLGNGTTIDFVYNVANSAWADMNFRATSTIFFHCSATYFVA